MSVCTTNPEIRGAEGCSVVIADWNCGIADTKRNRLVFWGGGHQGYYGNEIYALNLNDLTLTRLNNSSPAEDCVETLSDGKPNSRHTYVGLAYTSTGPTGDRAFMFGGYLECSGGAVGISLATWTLDPQTLQWRHMDPVNGGGPASRPTCCNYISEADFDPNTNAVFVHALDTFWKYDLASNTYTLLNSGLTTDYHLTAVIDPKRKLFMVLGNGEAHAVSIASGSNYAMQNWSLSSCGGLVSQIYPGLAYDLVQDRIVGWAGGNTVYLLNANTRLCTTVTYPGGPGAQQPNGTFGRFRYFPSLGVFAVVNDWQQNAFTVGLTPASGGTLSSTRTPQAAPGAGSPH